MIDPWNRDAKGQIWATNEERVNVYWSASGIPEEQRSAIKGIKTFHEHTLLHAQILAEVRRRVERAKEGDADALNILMSGRTGTGKTHLAVAIAAEFIGQPRRSVRFVDFRELLDELRGGGFSGVNVRDYADHESPWLLIVDDLGAEAPSAFQRSRLGAILAMRLSERRPTILTTNLAYPRGVAEILDDRLMSRIEARFGVFTMAFHDQRVLVPHGRAPKLSEPVDMLEETDNDDD